MLSVNRLQLCQNACCTWGAWPPRDLPAPRFGCVASQRGANAMDASCGYHSRLGSSLRGARENRTDRQCSGARRCCWGCCCWVRKLVWTATWGTAHSSHPSYNTAAWLTPAAAAPAPVAVTSRPGSRTPLPGPAAQAAPRWLPRSRGRLPHVRSCRPAGLGDGPAGLGDGPAGLGYRPMTTPPRTTHSKWLRNIVYLGPRLSLFA